MVRIALPPITCNQRVTILASLGTGTKVGDPIEVGAIGNCWGQDGIYIGAVSHVVARYWRSRDPGPMRGHMHMS